MAEKSVSLKIGQQKIPKLRSREDKEMEQNVEELKDSFIQCVYIYIQLKHLKENREKNNKYLK